MKKAIRLLIVVAASLTISGCKSSCDCYKHSYGDNSTNCQKTVVDKV